MTDEWVKGTDGEVSFDGEYLRIKRSGILGWAKGGGRGEIALHISQITGIELKKPGLTLGRFTPLAAGTSLATGGSYSKAHKHDPMTVEFQMNKLPLFAEIRDRVQQAIAARARGHVQPQGDDLTAQLQRLAELHRQGAIDDIEFQRAKARLLG